MKSNRQIQPWAPLGTAIEAFHQGQVDSLLGIESDIFESEDVPVRDYYRPLEDPLPELEMEAMRCCRGEILDLGAGAGRHSLELQKLGFQPLAVDISPKAVDIMRRRGVLRPRCMDFRKDLEGTFDTILMMMNGIGLAGSADQLIPMLDLLRSHLKPSGQILCDASSFTHDPRAVDLEALNQEARGKPELGEVWFRLIFGQLQGSWYPWLFPTTELLRQSCASAQLTMEILSRGAAGSYLARLGAC